MVSCGYFITACDFVAACEPLGTLAPWPARSAKPPQSRRVPKSWRLDRWQDEAWTLIAHTPALLERDAGAPARAYLQQGGIAPETWRAWQLGYGCDRPGSWGIVLPGLLPDGWITVVK
jgi:hypothetical protein